MTWARRAALVAAGVGGCVHPLADLGNIDHHLVVRAPHIDDPELGESSGTPVALRIPVGPHAGGDLGYVGRLAHAELFSDLPAFDFNVAFASAHVSLFGNSAYADPQSIWYNVFFGFYEIDAPMAEWSRPFGYDAPGPDAKVVARDIERIGRADWNYFSNHLYGVPLSAIRTCCASPPPGVVRVLPRVSLVSLDGPKDWDDLDVRDVTVVGPNRSTADGGAFEHPHSEHDSAPPGMERLWQRAFGVHAPTATPRTSFAPILLRARIRMFHDESRVKGKPVYRTFLFGATVRADAEPARADRFLRLQLAALEKVMKKTHLGFEEP
ncbi:MAG TPA: hypothetical protein VGP07_13610 [Polyangia bacterium]|jgi:hypothetical protein